MMDAGFHRSFSVGFQPKEFSPSNDKSRQWGLDYTKQSLFELTNVPVPANPHATLVGIYRDAKEQLQARAAELKASGRALDARIAKMPKPEPEKISPMLEQVRARRKERELIARMGPAEHAAYLNEKAARKERLQAMAKRLREGQA
jgi:hypothetical protein